MGRWSNKYVIGLTGNIAVGKSVVRQMLQHLGAYTIDADGLVHQAMAPGAPAYQPIVNTFGRFILDSDGRINRALLGSIAFAHPVALAKLEEITHPVVLSAINILISRATQRVIVVEAIKLLETSLAKDVDAVWVVDASPETQIKRLTDPGKRRMSEEDARKRIAAQPSQQEKLAHAAVVINNDGNIEETWRQVQLAWQNVQRTLSGGAPVKTDTQTIATISAEAPAPAPALATAQDKAAAVTAPLGTAPTINVRRGMPGNADQIAKFITKMSGRAVDRMSVMMAFGQKSYLLAQDGVEKVVACIGWQVENLITRADEFYIEPDVQAAPIVAALVTAIENASRELQSEVSFILLPAATPPDTVQSFVTNGYEITTLDQIRIPAWREAVQEISADNPRILTKKLRADRVMKPI